VDQRVMEGAEPFRFEGSEIGVLVSHGFTGTTQSVRPLGEALAEEGFTVMGPRLEGHGTSMEDHANSTASDWISSIEAGLNWLHQRTSQTFFVGLSMGGMFALYFAARYPDGIRGIVRGGHQPRDLVRRVGVDLAQRATESALEVVEVDAFQQAQAQERHEPRNPQPAPGLTR